MFAEIILRQTWHQRECQFYQVISIHSVKETFNDAPDTLCKNHFGIELKQKAPEKGTKSQNGRERDICQNVVDKHSKVSVDFFAPVTRLRSGTFFLFNALSEIALTSRSNTSPKLKNSFGLPNYPSNFHVWVKKLKFLLENENYTQKVLWRTFSSDTYPFYSKISQCGLAISKAKKIQKSVNLSSCHNKATKYNGTV